MFTSGGGEAIQPFSCFQELIFWVNVCDKREARIYTLSFCLVDLRCQTRANVCAGNFADNSSDRSQCLLTLRSISEQIFVVKQWQKSGKFGELPPVWVTHVE